MGVLYNRNLPITEVSLLLVVVLPGLAVLVSFGASLDHPPGAVASKRNRLDALKASHSVTVCSRVIW